MKKQTKKVHVIWTCQDCGMECPNWRNGEATAFNHAKRYKHRVTGEVGLAFEYNGH